MKFLVILVVLAICGSSQAGIAVGLPLTPIIYGNSGASDTQVVRDALGNQATAYSSAVWHHGPFAKSTVSVARSDVSKHLAYAPVAVAAPAYATYPAYAHHYPAVHHASYPVHHGGYYGGYYL